VSVAGRWSPATISVLETLQDAIDAMPAADNLTFLVTAQGKPFSSAGFGNWFRQICDQAELPKRCTSHGLRKAAATRLADRCATTTQLMAWFGWKTASEAEQYTVTLTGSTPRQAPESSFPEQQLANLKSSLPKWHTSH
jgi:integrase